MTITEAAERLQVEERTVRAWVASGDLKAINVSRSAESKKPRLRIMEEALQSFLTLRGVATAVHTPHSKLRPTKNYF